jgi:hypothetical protein
MTRELEPVDEQRRTAKAMSGYGIPQEDIAKFLDIDAKTLRKHFRRELDRGMTEANTKVAQTLFNMATVDKNVAAAIFWMKARAGWREKHEVTIRPDPVANMTDEELDYAIKRLSAEYAEDLAARSGEIPGPLTLDHDPDTEGDPR